MIRTRSCEGWTGSSAAVLSFELTSNVQVRQQRGAISVCLAVSDHIMQQRLAHCQPQVLPLSLPGQGGGIGVVSLPHREPRALLSEKASSWSKSSTPRLSLRRCWMLRTMFPRDERCNWPVICNEFQPKLRLFVLNNANN